MNDPDFSSSIPGQGRPGEGPGGSTTSVVPVINGGGGSSSSAVPVTIFALIVLLTLWILLAPRLIAAWNRGSRRTPRDRVVSAWHRACHSLSLAGAPPMGGETPLEYVYTAELATGVGDITLRELAVQVTRAVYSTSKMDDTIATRCETLESEVDARCRPLIPWKLRLRALVDPRMMRRRLLG